MCSTVISTSIPLRATTTIATSDLKVFQLCNSYIVHTYTKYRYSVCNKWPKHYTLVRKKKLNLRENTHIKNEPKSTNASRKNGPPQARRGWSAKHSNAASTTRSRHNSRLHSTPGTAKKASHNSATNKTLDMGGRTQRSATPNPPHTPPPLIPHQPHVTSRHVTSRHPQPHLRTTSSSALAMSAFRSCSTLAAVVFCPSISCFVNCERQTSGRTKKGNMNQNRNENET